MSKLGLSPFAHYLLNELVMFLASSIIIQAGQRLVNAPVVWT